MSFLRRHQYLLIQIFLLLVAVIFLSIDINRPLVDYDEALYAKVSVDTLKTGDISTLSLAGISWYDKPPLYFWIAITCVKFFGTSEFVFRIPSILFSVLSIWLTFLITKELTKNNFVSLSAALILLLSPAFFVFAREARLDSGVVASILFALFCYVKYPDKRKFLFWFFPAIAVGFLAKSVIVFLIAPIIFIYSILSKNWSWIKDKYLWLGSITSLVILLPWHILQYIRFGNEFINSYFLYHVIQRVTSTITGQSEYYDYLIILWQYYAPWIWILIILGTILPIVCFKKRLNLKFNLAQILAPLFSAIIIIILFTIARTHLSTYIMPAFPFFSIFIALSGYQLYLLFPKQKYLFVSILVIALTVAPFYCFRAAGEIVTRLHYEEKEVGLIYSNENKGEIPFYALGYPFIEEISYYGGRHLEFVDPNNLNGVVLKAPFYMVIPKNAIGFFYKNSTTAIPGYQDLKILYLGSDVVLFHSIVDFRLQKSN